MNETLIRSVRAFSRLLALCMLLACGAPTEQSNVAGPSPDATTEQNKQVVNDLFTAIDAGDLDTVRIGKFIRVRRRSARIFPTRIGLCGPIESR